MPAIGVRKNFSRKFRESPVKGCKVKPKSNKNESKPPKIVKPLYQYSDHVPVRGTVTPHPQLPQGDRQLGDQHEGKILKKMMK